MNKYAIISKNVPQICSALKKYDFKLIYSEAVDEFISYEKSHADMQVLKIGNKIFVLSQCKILGKKISELGFDMIYTEKEAKGKYPNNILLNCKVMGDRIISKLDSIDKSIIEYCKKAGSTLINVNQGYAACSCVDISDNAIITADKSIYTALKNTDIDVLKISEGHIKLDGAGENTYGFIGGSSVRLDNSNLLFFGNIAEHPDYISIKNFCQKHSVNIHSITDLPLTDVGGAILLKN